jgi:hypothetical protein
MPTCGLLAYPPGRLSRLVSYSSIRAKGVRRSIKGSDLVVLLNFFPVHQGGSHGTSIEIVGSLKA